MAVPRFIRRGHLLGAEAFPPLRGTEGPGACFASASGSQLDG